MHSVGLEASSSMYNALISACAKRGEVERAEKWLEHMIKAGVSVDVVTYSTVIHACAKSSDLTRAEQWMDHAHCRCRG
jgi:pentatricopeptide repeat protein